MAKQTFSSFKELLVKKELDSTERNVRQDVLMRIFRFVQPDIILSNAQHFEANDLDAIAKILKAEGLQAGPHGKAQAEAERIIREGLSEVSDKTKALLCDLLEDESKIAQKETQRMEKLAEKFHPKDPSEELTDLRGRIKEIELDIVDIEMSLMTLESEGLEGTERFKKASNARERRRQLIQRLEKQIQGVEKKLAKNS